MKSYTKIIIFLAVAAVSGVTIATRTPDGHQARPSWQGVVAPISAIANADALLRARVVQACWEMVFDKSICPPLDSVDSGVKLAVHRFTGPPPIFQK